MTAKPSPRKVFIDTHSDTALMLLAHKLRDLALDSAVLTLQFEHDLEVFREKHFRFVEITHGFNYESLGTTLDSVHVDEPTRQVTFVRDNGDKTIVDFAPGFQDYMNKRKVESDKLLENANAMADAMTSMRSDIWKKITARCRALGYMFITDDMPLELMSRFIQTPEVKAKSAGLEFMRELIKDIDPDVIKITVKDSSGVELKDLQ